MRPVETVDKPVDNLTWERQVRCSETTRPDGVQVRSGQNGPNTLSPAVIPDLGISGQVQVRGNRPPDLTDPLPIRGQAVGQAPGQTLTDTCPVCGEPAVYDAVLDRYRHVDDDLYDPCRLALLRGKPLEPIVPHALYRFWSADKLLYVGITMNPTVRWADHRHGKSWWEEITAITIERYTTRARALDAERAAIEREGPRHNVIWNHPRKSLDDLARDPAVARVRAQMAAAQVAAAEAVAAVPTTEGAST